METRKKVCNPVVLSSVYPLTLFYLWLYLYLSPSLSASPFLPLPLCLTFLCSVNCKLFPNATVSGISGKLNLAHIVLACTVCFIAQEMTWDAQIICTHCSPKNVMYTLTMEESAICGYKTLKYDEAYARIYGVTIHMFNFMLPCKSVSTSSFICCPQYAPLAPFLAVYSISAILICSLYALLL